MQNLKLYAHLRTMTAAECTAFGKWLHSPLHNTNKRLALLFEYMRKSAPDFNAPRLKPERLHKQLFTDQQFDLNRIRKLCTELIAQLSKFWVFTEHNQNVRHSQLESWRILNKRELRHYASGRRESLRKELFEEHYNNELQSLDRFRFALQEHEEIIEAGQRDIEPKLQPVSDTLDRFFVHQKLKYYCSALTQLRFLETEYDFKFINEVLKLAGTDAYQEFKGIQFYVLAIQSIEQEAEEGEQAYRKMKQLLFTDLRGADKEEMQNMLLLARNFCIQKINQRRRDYIQEVFELYRLEIERGLIYNQGKISEATYKNIGTAAMLLHEYEWLDQFLEANKQFVEPGSYYFNLASLRFSQKRFDEAVQLFGKASHQEVLMNLSAKAWLLKSYYELWVQHPDELEHDDRLEAHITAFTTFLNRKRKVLPDHYLFHLNLGKFVREMLRFSRPYQLDEEKLKDLLIRVQDSKQIAERRWLIEKLKGLLG